MGWTGDSDLCSWFLTEGWPVTGSRTMAVAGAKRASSWISKWFLTFGFRWKPPAEGRMNLWGRFISFKSKWLCDHHSALVRYCS
jgi:hypothetical protein